MSEEVKKSKIGGQALIEGVMMRGIDKISMAVRKPDGDISLDIDDASSLTNPKWYKKVPFIRGIFNMIDNMIIGYKYMMKSAEISGMEDLDDDEPLTPFEEKLTKLFGDKLFAVISVIGMILGVFLSIGLYIFLPSLVVRLFENFVELGAWKSLIEGVIKMIVFIVFFAVVSLMKDMRRVFQYHGAEHKSIACYEAGEELTPENVKKFTRFHPRCGTSFIVIVLVISILLASVITWETLWLRTLIKICMLPITAGVSYELIRLAGRHDNVITRIVSAPGLWMQRITTKEPDLEQIAVAIKALDAVIPENTEEDRW